jgi:hypothetical protein
VPCHFFYVRHFLLLTCFGVLTGLMSRLHLSSDITGSFALYGALHALALILALRARQSIWRRCLFIALAAALSALTLRLGILETHVSGKLPGNIGMYAVSVFSAMTGAAAYGISIRLFGIYELTLRELAVIAIGCMSATYLGMLTLAHSLGPWWLAVLWWYAFSGALWYCDRRHHAVSFKDSGEN